VADQRATSIALMFLLACGMVKTPRALAADLERKPSQLNVRHWTKADGLPAEFVWSAYQSPSGYLWLATDTGIARFDGLNFKTYGSSTDKAFRSNDIREITGAPDGTVWAASVGGGVLRLDESGVTRLGVEQGLASDAVYSVLVADNGDVWAGTASGACRLRESRFRCWGTQNGMVGGRIVRLAEDSQHRIWFASVTSGISVLVDDQVRSFGPDDGFGDGGTTVLLAHPRFNMIVGSLAGNYYRADASGVRPLEIALPPAEFKPFNALRDRDGNTMISMLGAIWQIEPTLRRLDDGAADIGYVTGLLEDRDGQLWASTSTGLYQFGAAPFTPFGETEGVANQTFVVDGETDGSVWTGTESDGVFHVWPGGQVRQFTTDDGLPMNAVSSLLVEQDATVWLGTFGAGMAIMRGDQIVRVITTDDGLAGNRIGSIARDRDGSIWVGTDAGLNRLTDGEVTATLTVKDGLLADLVRNISQDADGRLLLSGDNGITIISPSSLKIIDRVDQSRGLDNQAIATTFVDERGVIWIGGRSGGLIRMQGDQTFAFKAQHGLKQTSVMTIEQDEEEYLWLGGRDGVTRVLRADLDAVAAGDRKQLRTRSFTTRDGLRTTRVSGGYQSASTLSSDGRVWLATTSGLAVVDPARLNTASTAPTVSIDVVRADGVVLARGEGGEYRIPAGTDSLEIDYAAPDINRADALRFHYRLGNGRWQAAEQRRTAFFNALPPRATSFEVAAHIDGDVFDAERGVRVALYVEPLWHQTYLARALAAFAFSFMLWCGNRLTVRYHQRRQRRLEKLVDERTAALQDALKEVRALSRVDGLTGVANRRHFDERLAQIWASAVRQQHPVGVMMIDIDHFKRFNDAAGHQEGDRCLKLVAQALQSTVRTEDFVARYGGEEFAVILTGDDVDHMWSIAGRLQAAVRAMALPHPGLTRGAIVSMSAGFAAAEPATGEDPEHLIRRADEALYRAKEEGRNRVVRSYLDGEAAHLSLVGGSS
jgi:diguanylate cyclase (GGDEF)-like protein